jgi:hypothetical protein
MIGFSSAIPPPYMPRPQLFEKLGIYLIYSPCQILHYVGTNQWTVKSQLGV